MPQVVVGQHEREHRLGDGHPRYDAGVVAPRSFSTGCPATSIEVPGLTMLEVGLTAMRTSTCCPDEMPPSVPPASFDRKPCGVISSRCCEPRCSTQAKPAPISTPLTALMLIIACARSASSRSNAGSPRPGGTPVATTLTRAPMNGPRDAARRSWLRVQARAQVRRRKTHASMASRSSMASLSKPIWPGAEMSMPFAARNLRAIAPAATRITVSRADERPPPR